MNFRDSWKAEWENGALHISGTTDRFPYDFFTASLRRVRSDDPGIARYEVVFGRDKEPFCGPDLVGPVHFWDRIDLGVRTVRIFVPDDDEFAEVPVPAR
jgi:hypothetical protein